jgi:uncharacterized membrane protein HdeD (DUF308 family)
VSPIQPLDIAKISTALKKAMHEHWKIFLAEGIVLWLLGLAAIIVPPLAGLATTLILGWIFVASGIVGLLFTLRARYAPGSRWALLSAVVAIVAGGILLWDPLQGLVTLTYVLTAFFIIDGIVIVAYAIAHRRQLSGKWEWMMVNGIIDLVLAGIILSGLPWTLSWALGLLIGIDLVFGGTSLIAMALRARREALS